MKNSSKTFMAFLRRNGVYLVLAFCILAVGIATTFMLISRVNETNAELNNSNTIETPDEPTTNPDTPVVPDEPVEKPSTPTEPETPVVETIVFDMPVKSPTSIVDYSDTMVFNSTLGRYSAHKAIDFFAEEGAEVYAVYDGVVQSVDNSVIHGVTVKIDHGNGLVTVYNSLLDIDAISVGDVVKKGDVIGQVSTSNRQEYKEGAHLHFEVIENGEVIDPVKYLAFEEK